MNEEIPIEVNSIFGFMTGRGLVELKVRGESIQMPVAKAREIGIWLLEAAMAAESDAAFVQLLSDVKMKQDAIGEMLLALRRKRADIQGQEKEE